MPHRASVDEAGLQARLRQSDFSELRVIELSRVGDLLVLQGVVGSYYYKQLAQELVKSGAKGLQIENQICVEYVEVEITPDWQDIGGEGGV